MSNINFTDLRRRVREDPDPSFAVFMVRDTPEVAAADLTHLAWALCNDGNCSRNDALGFLDLLEQAQA